jgi:hypothetical protein
VDPLASAAAIEGHYDSHWGRVVSRHRWHAGPAHELPAGFEVLRFARRDAQCYATSCMSQPADDEPLELHLLAPAAPSVRDELVELLTAVAHDHRTGHRLGVTHSVDFGRPWLAGATSSFGLLSLRWLSLEARFESARFDFLAPHRASVV